MNASREALLAAQRLEAELLFSQPAEPNQDPELRLLGFCLRQLGERQLPLAPLPGAPPPPGFALHYGDGRALLLQLSAGGRQLVCGHEPSLGSRMDGELQPLLSSLSLERLLRAASSWDKAGR